MTQASLKRKKIRYSIPKSSITKVSNQILLISSKKAFRKASRWLVGTIALSAMLCWNWKLVMATGVGVGSMLLVYNMQGWNWQLYYVRWQRFLQGSQGKLTLAVGGGGLAAFATYLAASIWADSENRWLATGAILQGAGTLFTLALLSWHIVGHQKNRDAGQFEQLLRDLTDSNPVKRLIAVRQLTDLVRESRCDRLDREQLDRYFCLMLARESEPVVREAVLESLQKWERKPLKHLTHKTLKMSVDA